jgi:hypothetical protein
MHVANLRGAHVLNCDLRGANLLGAWLDDKETDLRGADVRGSDFTEALLDEADMRRVRGLILNSTRVRNTRFSPTARDPWSVLRRGYTGPRLGFNLIVLLLFLAPYAAKTAAWVGVNRVQTNLNNAASWVSNRAGSVAGNNSPQDSALKATSEYLVMHAPSEEHGWREYRVWELLIGVDREFTYWATAIALIVYNFGRAFLTLMVAPLRDEEERSGHAPAYRPDSYWQFRNAYGWMAWPHSVVRGLFAFAVIAFFFHLASWLNLPVLLPPV